MTDLVDKEKMVDGPLLQERGSYSPSAPPTYNEAMGGVPPAGPFTPQNSSMVQTHVVTTTMAVPVGAQSTHMVCPKCHVEINTLTRLERPRKAYLICCIVCLFGGCLGCCLIPLFSKKFKDTHHSCPSCGAHLGVFPATAQAHRRRPRAGRGRFRR